MAARAAAPPEVAEQGGTVFSQRVQDIALGQYADNGLTVGTHDDSANALQAHAADHCVDGRVRPYGDHPGALALQNIAYLHCDTPLLCQVKALSPELGCGETRLRTRKRAEFAMGAHVRFRIESGLRSRAARCQRSARSGPRWGLRHGYC